MVDITKHFIRGFGRDSSYDLGPNVNYKTYKQSQSLKLTITEFLTPNLFFGIEMVDSEYEFDEKLNLMYSSFYKYFRFENLPKVGTMVVANYHEDRRWYRARVMQRYPEDERVDVYFIDFGNIEKGVSMRKICKLESTFSSQFCSFMKSDFLKSQAVLFGYIGSIPISERQFTTKKSKKLNNILLKRPFEFQVLEIPHMSSRVRNKFHVRIPFYLIKNNTFNDVEESNYQIWLENNLKWRQSTFNESLDLIIDYVNELDPANLIYKEGLIMPYSLTSLQGDRKCYGSDGDNKKKSKPEHHKPRVYRESFNSDDSDTNTRRKVCQTNKDMARHNDTDLFDGNDDRSSNGSCVNDLSDEEALKNNRNSYDVTVKDETINNLEISVEELEEQMIVSFKHWKLTNKTVKSAFNCLNWHFPLPDEEIFAALVSTEMNSDLVFYINVIQQGISTTFNNQEQLLQRHYILCHDSMLKQYIHKDFHPVENQLCLCSYDSTYYRCVVVNKLESLDKYQVICIDIGDKLQVNKSDLIPISSQFCQIPQLALQCNLAGVSFHDATQNIKEKFIEKFNAILEENKYEVLVRLHTESNSEIESNERKLYSQPLSVELFINKNQETNDTKFNSINLILHHWIKEVNGENITSIEEEEENHDDECVSLSSSTEEGELNTTMEDNCIKNLENEEPSTVENCELKDIYLRENIYQQAEKGNNQGIRPVCEYYRRKGRCFRGKLCPDRHVMHTDDELSDEQVQEETSTSTNKQYQLAKSLMIDDFDRPSSKFQRNIDIGVVVGLRVTSIYANGLFYGYLTHGINGLNVVCGSDNSDGDDNSDVDKDLVDTNDDSESMSDATDGPKEIPLNFSSIHDMEESLNEYLKYESNPIEKSIELVKGAFVAVRRKESVHRATIQQKVSGSIYLVFLLDYGITCEVDKRSIFYLPDKYYRKFRQQCFMFKLNGLSSSDTAKYQEFVEWFYNKVNDRVIHAIIIDSYEDGLYIVDLYDFLSEGSAAQSLTAQFNKISFN